MPRPRRRLALGVFIVLFAVMTTAALRVGLEWKKAVDDVDAMIVPVVELPTEVPVASSSSASAPLPQPSPAPTEIPAPDRPVNILLLGTDARPGEDISRTDAIIVVHVDPKTNRVSMLSLPRDMQVDIPRYGKGRINTAYMLGEEKIGKGYGPGLAKQTVGNLLGMRIDHFVLINFDGFQTLIDKLGGITVDVPKVIDDPKYPLNEFPGDSRWKAIHFDAGVQRMDGETALIYARTRHADSDFGRHQRQQQVLMAIFDRVRERGLMSQLTSLDDYTDALRNSIRTDMSREKMLSLAAVGPQLRPQNIERFAIDPSLFKVQKSPYLLILSDKKPLAQLVAQMTGEQVAAAGGDDPSK